MSSTRKEWRNSLWAAQHRFLCLHRRLFRGPELPGRHQPVGQLPGRAGLCNRQPQFERLVRSWNSAVATASCHQHAKLRFAAQRTSHAVRRRHSAGRGARQMVITTTPAAPPRAQNSAWRPASFSWGPTRLPPCTAATRITTRLRPLPSALRSRARERCPERPRRLPSASHRPARRRLVTWSLLKRW